MIETFVFTNLFNRLKWTFNTDDCPMQVFNIDGATRMTDRAKMQLSGDWEGFNYLDHQILHIEGAILRDTTEDRNAARLAVLKACNPPPGRQKIRAWGTLAIKYYGTSLMTNRVTGEGYTNLPVDVEHPNTVQPYQIAWKIFDPYWTASNGDKYLI
jgi:hypothetical protein